MRFVRHQYIDRKTGRVCTEQLYGDWLLNTLYVAAWEHAPVLYRALTSTHFSSLLGLFCYDSPLGARISGHRRFLRSCGINVDECLDPPAKLDTARKIFERKIRYWSCRPLPGNPQAIISPTDARVLVGSWRETSQLFLKEKLFACAELLGFDTPRWASQFMGGDFAVFRLTPDKYHYNHTPVAGVVRDCYEAPGGCHSCNPSLLVATQFPYAKNRRVVTIIDTDIAGGSQIGLVAMIEIVALMIGDIVQCYSTALYDAPRSIAPGMFLQKGQPKSLYRPGSSTTVLLFQPGCVEFSPDLLANRNRSDVTSRFSQGLGCPLVETEVVVRSEIALPKAQSLRARQTEQRTAPLALPLR